MKLYDVETDAGTVRVKAENPPHACALALRRCGAHRALVAREVAVEEATGLPVLKKKKKKKKVTP